MTALTVAELRTWLRDPDIEDDDEPTLRMIIELVDGLVNQYGPFPTPEPVQVRLVRLNAAARAWRNPEGFTSRTERIDDYSDTKSLGRNAQVGEGVYLTDAERRTLMAAGTVVVDEVPWAGSLPYRR